MAVNLSKKVKQTSRATPFSKENEDIVDSPIKKTDSTNKNEPSRKLVSKGVSKILLIGSSIIKGVNPRGLNPTVHMHVRTNRGVMAKYLTNWTKWTRAVLFLRGNDVFYKLHSSLIMITKICSTN